jgi:VWFA-related protein
VAVVSYGTSLVVHQDFSRDRGDLAKAVEAAVVGAEPKGNWPSRLPPEGEPSLLRHLPRGRELRSATANVHEAFTELGKAARPFVGRKNLVLFSGGFGRLDDFRQYVPDPRYHEPMEHALNDANVAVYAIDLFPPGNYHALAGSLSLLAEQTGGRYYPNVVNFLSPLEALASEASGYYLLAYQSPHPRGASGFQQVEVKVKNPEFRVKARRGYTFGAG